MSRRTLSADSASWIPSCFRQNRKRISSIFHFNLIKVKSISIAFVLHWIFVSLKGEEGGGGREGVSEAILTGIQLLNVNQSCKDQEWDGEIGSGDG